MAKLEEIKKQNAGAVSKSFAKKKLPPPPAVFSNFEMWKSGRTAGMWDEYSFIWRISKYNENGLFIYKVPQL